MPTVRYLLETFKRSLAFISYYIWQLHVACELTTDRKMYLSLSIVFYDTHSCNFRELICLRMRAGKTKIPRHDYFKCS